MLTTLLHFGLPMAVLLVWSPWRLTRESRWDKAIVAYRSDHGETVE